MVDKINANLKDLYASKYDNDGAQMDYLSPYIYQTQSMLKVGQGTYPMAGYVMESNTFDKLLSYLGTTEKWNEAGFILPDGSLVDMSGKSSGGSANNRNLEHKDVDSFGYNLSELLDNGAIRVGCDFVKPSFVQISIKNGTPTRAQWEKIDELLSTSPYKVDFEVTPEGSDKNNPRTNFYRQYTIENEIKDIKQDLNAYINGDKTFIGLPSVMDETTKPLCFAKGHYGAIGDGSNPMLTGIQPMWALNQGGVIDLNEKKLHDQLSPLLWDQDDNLKDDVYDKLMEIAALFIDNLKLDAPEDIYITGSFANYNYSDDKDSEGQYKSDIDLHLVYDFDKLNIDHDILSGYFKAKKQIFNEKYNFTIHDIPVEVGVENINEPLTSTGIYSLYDKQWKEVPHNAGKEIPDVDEDKYSELTQQIEKTIETQDENQVKELLSLIRKMRKNSLAQDGEFGEGNLLFKKLRNDGYIKRLKEVLNDLISKNLSLEMFYTSRNYPKTVIPTAPEIRKM